MHPLLRLAPILLVVLAGACDGRSPEPTAANEGPRDDAPAPVAARIGVPFTLAFGDSARVDGSGLTVAFRAVQEDSRCPTGVTCVWEGNARIVLDVREGEGPSAPRVLNTTLDPRSATAAGYRLELVELLPWPAEGQLTPEERYEVRLRVSGP